MMYVEYFFYESRQDKMHFFCIFLDSTRAHEKRPPADIPTGGLDPGRKCREAAYSSGWRSISAPTVESFSSSRS